MNTNKELVITVALVEDSTPVRRSLEEIINSTPGLSCVAACATGEEALKVLPPQRPRVVFMDISLPGMNGVECVRRLVQKLPGVLVVMLTVHDQDEPIFNSLAAGAYGYLHKPIRADELIAAVHEVHVGGSPMTSSVARRVVKAFNRNTRPSTAATVSSTLTDSEREVLECLSQGYSYKEIADQKNVSWHTIHTHIRHIYEKLQVRSRGEAVAKYLRH